MIVWSPQASAEPATGSGAQSLLSSSQAGPQQSNHRLDLSPWLDDVGLRGCQTQEGAQHIEGPTAATHLHPVAEQHNGDEHGRRTDFALFGLAIPSVTGHSVSLLRYGVSRIVEHFFDLCKRDFLGIVIDVDSPGWDINLDLAHTLQFSNGPFNRVLAMLARNVWSHKCCRFHEAYPPLILSNRLKSKQYREGSYRFPAIV